MGKGWVVAVRVCCAKWDIGYKEENERKESLRVNFEILKKYMGILVNTFGTEQLKSVHTLVVGVNISPFGAGKIRVRQGGGENATSVPPTFFYLLLLDSWKRGDLYP